MIPTLFCLEKSKPKRLICRKITKAETLAARIGTVDENALVRRSQAQPVAGNVLDALRVAAVFHVVGQVGVCLGLSRHLPAQVVPLRLGGGDLSLQIQKRSRQVNQQSEYDDFCEQTRLFCLYHGPFPPFPRPDFASGSPFLRVSALFYTISGHNERYFLQF